MLLYNTIFEIILERTITFLTNYNHLSNLGESLLCINDILSILIKYINKINK